MQGVAFAAYLCELSELYYFMWAIQVTRIITGGLFLSDVQRREWANFLLSQDDGNTGILSTPRLIKKKEPIFGAEKKNLRKRNQTEKSFLFQKNSLSKKYSLLFFRLSHVKKVDQLTKSSDKATGHA